MSVFEYVQRLDRKLERVIDYCRLENPDDGGLGEAGEDGLDRIERRLDLVELPH